MLNILLFLSLIVHHPPRERQYPWRLMVGTETPQGIAWRDTDQAFLEAQDCFRETMQYKVAECVKEPDYA